MVVELVEEESLLMVVWLVLAVTALTLGMVVDRMGVQVEMMVERIIRLGKASDLKYPPQYCGEKYKNYGWA